MEEIRGHGSQQLSILVYLSTKQGEQLSIGDKAERSRCSNDQITDIVLLELLSICATFKTRRKKKVTHSDLLEVRQWKIKRIPNQKRE
jgi:hypothetical protein